MAAVAHLIWSLPMDAQSPRSLEPSKLQRIAAGDQLAVREVIESYGGLIWSIARRYDPDDPEDAVQEIFLDLWKNAARFDSTVSTEATFVAMIARRRAIDRRRRRSSRERTVSQLDTAQLVEPPNPERGAEAVLVAKCFEQLTVEQREVLVLAICEGLTHSEIAARLAMPLGTVKAHARRGLLAMRAAAHLSAEGTV